MLLHNQQATQEKKKSGEKKEEKKAARKKPMQEVGIREGRANLKNRQEVSQKDHIKQQAGKSTQDKVVVEHREGRRLIWPVHRWAGPGEGGPLWVDCLTVAWAVGRPPPASAGPQMRYCAGDAP